MSLEANSSPESARRKFFMKSHHVWNIISSRRESRNQTFLGSGGHKSSLEENFSTRPTSSLESRNQTFLGIKPNESNSQ